MTSRSAHPLLLTTNLSAPLAWRHGQAISGAQFIAEAQALAEQLPPDTKNGAGRPINLCQDRYHFALGLAAALLRGHTSLMPPNALPETLRLAPSAGGTVYALTDDVALDVGTLHRVHVQRPLHAHAVQPATAVPRIDDALEAVCLLTSGSTGAPQPHAKRWGQLVANIAAQAQRLAQMMNRPDLNGLTLVATVPAQHSYGLESSVLLALLGGAAFEAGRPFYPADICSTLSSVPQPRALVTTPFHLKTLLLADVPLPPAALTLSATAPLSPQLAAQAETALAGALIEIYGCTEAGQVASRRTTAGEVWTTLGDLRIHREAETNEAEQFVVRGGHVTEPTPLADVLALQDAQHFRLLGRANDLIHVAGKRSSLAHLNFHLNRIEGVDDGAFWLPDEVAEAVVRPVAFVVAPGLTARQVIHALREHLEPAFVPRRVVQVAALPREATGKLTTSALRAFALHTLAQQDTHDGDITLHIATDHPAFAGHFPGQPLLPGAALLALVLDALVQRPALHMRLGTTPRIDNTKFLVPVGPGAQLRITFREQGSGVAFEVHGDGNTVVARGQLSAASSAAP
jgi:3-hydroxymyristoyl/3-hydroxydecanoyl-(acyl carrier protein) dehydratase